MLEALDGCTPARLYRMLADEMGVHPVTLLRYHRGQLATLSSERMGKLRGVHRRILAGELLPPEPPERDRLARCNGNGRVPAARLRPLFDRLLERLQITERQVLYRCLTERTGLHETTLLRYHTGALQTAPVALERALRELLSECATDRFPVLKRADGGDAVVPRAVYRARVDRLERTGEYQHKSELFRDLASLVDQPAERLRKAYYDSRIRLVPRSFPDGADKLTEQMIYDPSRVWGVGERILHPHFGAGVVREKRPHRAVLVELEGGGEVLLREGYRHDPYREQRTDRGWNPGTRRTRPLAS